MNRQFHNKRQSLRVTEKQSVWAVYMTDQKSFTGHMVSIKLEEKSYKMRPKALPVKIQRSRNRHGGRGAYCAPLAPGQIGLNDVL